MDKDMEKRKRHDNPNAGHRTRLKTKYLKGGADLLTFHEFLELLLFYSIPRKDTNKIAHELEDKFNGSLINILEASDSILKEVDGLSDQTVLFFRLLSDTTRMYNVERSNRIKSVGSMKIQEGFLVAHFTGKLVEEVVMLTLNNRMERLSHHVIYIGNVNSAKVDKNKMVKIALEKNASGVIVAHNHLNGSVIPSPEDMETTRQLHRLFTDININFIEHFVVSDIKVSGITEKSIKHLYIK